MISVEEAFSQVETNTPELDSQTVSLLSAVGQVLRADVVSDVNAPPHDKSVMDGFAVRVDDVVASGAKLKIVETIVAGQVPSLALKAGEAARIMTGAPLPVGAEAVVMVELTEVDPAEPDYVTIMAGPIPTGKHIMHKACTLSVGDVVFRAGHQVRAVDVGLLAESGAATVVVGRRPTLSVLPTGDELVDCDQVPGAGQIRNSNGPMLCALGQALGLETRAMGIGRDEPEALAAKIKQGLESDILVMSGGVSAGQLDLVPGILNGLGVRKVFHKVHVKPGKPIWFGVKENDGRSPTLVFGLPGNPVSSLIGFQLFVRTAIRRMMGGESVRPQGLQATLSSAHQTRGDRPTFWPGQMLVEDSAGRRVQPLEWLGSSDLRTLGRADCLIYFLPETHEHEAGKLVTVYFFDD